MTEAELVSEIEGENRNPLGLNSYADESPRKLTETEGEAIMTATSLICSALRMLGEANAPAHRSEINARLSAAMTLVATL